MLSVYVSFTLDIVHSGHLKVLEKASQLGKVTVGMLSDKAVVGHRSLPIVNYEQRKRIALGLKGVDKVVEQNEWSNVSNLLNMHHVLVVHGNDGLDEISITDKTFVTELKDGNLNQFEIQPEDFGLRRSNITALKAETPEESLELINAAFEGKESPVQDMISLNAGAALYLSSLSKSIKEGVSLAKELLNNGKAKQTFSSYIEMTNSL